MADQDGPPPPPPPPAPTVDAPNVNVSDKAAAHAAHADADDHAGAHAHGPTSQPRRTGLRTRIPLTAPNFNLNLGQKLSNHAPHLWNQTKLIAPPLVATFLLSVLVLVRPVAEWTGRYAFLSFVFLPLFFYPAPSTVGTHIEATILGVLGSAIGLGISFLAISGAVWIDGPHNGPYAGRQSRAVGACALVGLCFIGGLISSMNSRLKNGVRICIFVSIWACTSGATTHTAKTFTELFYPTFICAGVCLLCNLLIFPRTSNAAFARLVIKTLDTTMAILEQTLEDFFSAQASPPAADSSSEVSAASVIMSDSRPVPVASERLSKLRAELLKCSSDILPAFEMASFELTYTRVPVHKYKPLIRITRNIRSWVACGMGLRHAREQLLHDMEEDAHPEMLPEENVREEAEAEAEVEAQSGEQQAYTPDGLSGAQAPGTATPAAASASVFEPAIRTLCGETIRSLQLVRYCVDWSTGSTPAQAARDAHSGLQSALYAATLAAGHDLKQDPAAADRIVLRQRKRLAETMASFKEELQRALDGVKPLNKKGTEREEVVDPAESKRRTAVPADGEGHHAHQKRASFGAYVPSPLSHGNFAARTRPLVVRAISDQQVTTFKHGQAGSSSPGGGGDTETEDSPSTPAPSRNGGTQDGAVEVGDGEGGDTLDDGADHAHLFRSEMYHLSMLMISLLEIAQEAGAALQAVQALLRFQHAHPRRRVWWPAYRGWIGWRTWSGKAESGAMNHLMGNIGTDRNADDSPRSLEDRGVDKEQQHIFDEAVAGEKRRPPYVSPRPGSTGWVKFIERWTRKSSVLRFRVKLSRSIRDTKHSRHFKYALKLAGGVALLSLPAYLGGSPREWFTNQRGQWLLITYCWCLESSTGASIRVSTFRMIGTVLGAIYGYLIWVFSGQGNPYGLSILLTVGAIPTAWLILFTNLQGIGIVGGLTYSVIALIPYLGLDNKPVIILACIRGYMIALGIVASLLVNLFIWPFHARLHFITSVAHATGQLQSLYLSLSRQTLQAGLVTSAETRAGFETLERTIETTLGHTRSLVDLMLAEVSLLPKPIKEFRSILNKLQVVADLLVGLRQVREHGLRSIRNETVINVMDFRSQLVSAVLINLWVVGQSLKTRAPLPQFLPSPRHALIELTHALRTQVSQPTAEPPHPDAFYALSSLSGMAMAHGNGDRQFGLRSRRAHSKTRLRTSTSDHTSRSPSRTRSPDLITTPGTPVSRRRRLDPSYFFVFAEHALLSEIIDALEALLFLTKMLVGEASFLSTEFIPRGHGQRGNGMQEMHPLSVTTLSLSQMQQLSLQVELAAQGMASRHASRTGTERDVLPTAYFNRSNMAAAVASASAAAEATDKLPAATGASTRTNQAPTEPLSLIYEQSAPTSEAPTSPTSVSPHSPSRASHAQSQPQSQPQSQNQSLLQPPASQSQFQSQFQSQSLSHSHSQTHTHSHPQTQIYSHSQPSSSPRTGSTGRAGLAALFDAPAPAPAPSSKDTS